MQYYFMHIQFKFKRFNIYCFDFLKCPKKCVIFVPDDDTAEQIRTGLEKCPQALGPGGKGAPSVSKGPKPRNYGHC